MTREQAKNDLIGYGIAEPTDEQISNYLNKINSETKREKDLAERYKSDALKVKDLESQLEEINNKNLSDLDLAKKDTEKANGTIADLQRQIAIMQRKNALAEKGIVGEVADKLFNDDGSIDFEVFGSILAERENLAKTRVEQEILKGTPNPSGSDKKESEEMSDVEKMATSVGKSIAESNKVAGDVLANYIK